MLKSGLICHFRKTGRLISSRVQYAADFERGNYGENRTKNWGPSCECYNWNSALMRNVITRLQCTGKSSQQLSYEVSSVVWLRESFKSTPNFTDAAVSAPLIYNTKHSYIKSCLPVESRKMLPFSSLVLRTRWSANRRSAVVSESCRRRSTSWKRTLPSVTYRYRRFVTYLNFTGTTGYFIISPHETSGEHSINKNFAQANAQQ